ncbi:MAG TPA: FAD-binding oxidoreductase [Candidatus Methylomirabilis sp.]|nr:FAD-binding oxidoreductase [Candidatus Methylomirabilis sp.]
MSARGRLGSDCLVIGGGCVGANVAYRLADRGAAVVLLEAGAPGGGTSGASFAWTNSFSKTPRDYHDLNVASMEEHAALAKELGGGEWLHQEGALAWEELPAGQVRLDQTVARLASWGYPVERISPREAREMEPDLHIAERVEAVIWTPGEGYVEVVPFIRALLGQAARRGARVLSGRRVTEVMRAGDRVRGVVTEDGSRFEADVVVDCAGVAAGDIARLAGVALPLGGVPGRLVYTAPVAVALRRPVHAAGVHFRPDGGGRIVLAEYAHDQVWSESTGAWPAERSLAAAARHLPALERARVETTRVGVRPMPRDERPVVGRIDGLDGFYIAVSHSGVTLGPLWGRIAAAELLDAAVDPRLAPYRPARLLEAR